MLSKRMKKYLSVVAMIQLVLLSSVSYANSGPTSWEGSAGAEIMTIDENTPIEVLNEKLIIDLRDMTYVDYTMAGTIIANYQMHNTSEAVQNTMMTFPMISYNQISAENIEISVDGENMDYSLHPYKIYNGSGFNFNNIVANIQADYRTDTIFAKNTVGTLMSFGSRVSGEEYDEISVDIIYDPTLTSIITDDFNSGHYDRGHAVLGADLRGDQSASIYYTGDAPAITYSENCDLLFAEEKNFLEYYSDTIIPLINQQRNNPEAEILTDQYDPVSLFNMVAGYLQVLVYNQNAITELYALESILYGDQILSANYEVLFEPDQTRNLQVAYQVKASMERKSYGSRSDGHYTFEYFLSPAKSWKSFGDLTIEVLIDAEQWIIEDTNLLLEPTESGFLMKSEGLLDEDLHITIQEVDTDRGVSMENGFSLLGKTLFFIGLFALFILTCALLFYLYWRRRK